MGHKTSSEFVSCNYMEHLSILLSLQIDHARNDRRLHHPRSNSEITKYMDAAWRQKEQEKLQE